MKRDRSTADNLRHFDCKSHTHTPLVTWQAAHHHSWGSAGGHTWHPCNANRQRFISFIGSGTNTEHSGPLSLLSVVIYLSSHEERKTQMTSSTKTKTWKDMRYARSVQYGQWLSWPSISGFFQGNPGPKWRALRGMTPGSRVWGRLPQNICAILWNSPLAEACSKALGVDRWIPAEKKCLDATSLVDFDSSSRSEFIPMKLLLTGIAGQVETPQDAES